MVGLTFNSSS